MARTKKEKKDFSDQPPIGEVGKVRGFFRLQIVEDDGEVVGDTGWRSNVICTHTEGGFNRYLVRALCNSTPLNIGYVALGSGTTVAASATALPGEWNSTQSNIFTNGSWRKAVTPTTSATAITFNATFESSGWHTNTGQMRIENVGLYSGSTGTGLFAGNNFGASSVASNQAVNVTYTINFS